MVLINKSFWGEKWLIDIKIMSQCKNRNGKIGFKLNIMYYLMVRVWVRSFLILTFSWFRNSLHDCIDLCFGRRVSHPAHLSASAGTVSLLTLQQRLLEHHWSYFEICFICPQGFRGTCFLLLLMFCLLYVSFLVFVSEGKSINQNSSLVVIKIL